MKTIVALVTVCALLVSCSESGTAEDTTTTTAVVSTSTTAPAAATTTPPEPTTTAPAETTTTTTEASTTTVDPLAAEGAGCTPGTDDLPDGVWYGVVADFDSDGISFDLACFFSGDAAIAASAEDGEESPPPNDYYVRNQNELLRVLVVDSEIPVLWYLSGDPNVSQQGTFTEWTDSLEARDWRFAVWVTIEEGSVSEIEEQWVP